MINNMTPVVKQLLIVNIMFFLGSMLVPNAEHFLALYYFENPNFRFWQPLTHMFMHGGIAHIAFNMFALVSFGNLLENYWGSKKFIFFYLSCGIGAAFVHLGVNYYHVHEGVNLLIEQGFSKSEIFDVLNGKNNQELISILNSADYSKMVESYFTPAVGASGAIYGLLTAFAFMFPNAELALMFIPVPIKAKYFVPVLVGLDLFSGVTGYSIFGAGIAHFAHVGGALVGFIMMWFWKKNSFNDRRWN